MLKNLKLLKGQILLVLNLLGKDWLYSFTLNVTFDTTFSALFTWFTWFAQSKLCFETKSTTICSKIYLVKSSENNFVFLPVFYLIMWLMKALKNFGKLAILKIWELISLGGVKTHFGKLMMHLQAGLFLFAVIML